MLPGSIPLNTLSPETVAGAKGSSSFRPSQETGTSIMDMETNEILNGLRRKRSRWIIFNEIKKLNVDICFLQETHVQPDDIDVWQREWGGDIHYVSGTSFSNGQVILLKNSFDCSNVTTLISNERLLGISLEYQNEKYHIVSVYIVPIKPKKRLNIMHM